MTALTVLGVPTSAGAFAPGQERAPAALREAGLLAALGERGVRRARPRRLAAVALAARPRATARAEPATR